MVSLLDDGSGYFNGDGRSAEAGSPKATSMMAVREVASFSTDACMPIDSCCSSCEVTGGDTVCDFLLMSWRVH